MVAKHVVLAETHHPPRFFANLPAARCFVEMAQHLGDAQPALHFELAVKPAARGADRAVGDIGAEDVDVPPVPAVFLIHEQHRHRIGFLPGRTARRPDRQTAAIAPPLGQFGQDFRW